MSGKEGVTVYKQKEFNLEILTWNLVIFKRWDGVKDEKF